MSFIFDAFKAAADWVNKNIVSPIANVVNNILTPKPADEFKDTKELDKRPPEEAEEALKSVTNVEEKPPSEPKPEEKQQLPNLLDVASKALSAATTFMTPTPVLEAFKAAGDVAKYIVDKVTGNPAAESNPVKVIGEPIMKAAEALGGPVKGFVDGVSSAVKGVEAFGRGVMYAITGPPPDEDLSDEIAATKGVGMTLMATAPAGATVAALTGVGGAVAPLLGGLGLLGWALTDNVAGRLEFIQSQREKEKKQKEYEREREEQAKKEREAWLESQKAAADYKAAKENERIATQISELMARVAAIKELKAYATPEEREELEKLEKEVNDFIAGLQKQQELNVEEKEKRLQRYREITEKLYKEIEEEKRRSEEEKRKAEEEERKFSALNTSIRAALDEIKGLMSAAGNAYFAKSYELALTTMREAGERVGALKAKIEENKELLDKFGYYAAYMDQARALENVVNATIKAWQGINPNRELVNAMTNYANSTVQFNRKAAERVERKMVYKVTDPDDVKEMKDVARVERKNAAVGRMLSATTASFLSAVPVIAYQPSKLDPATIVKFRTWLATNRSTPCKAIANYTWNVASGYSYDDKMIYLMRMAAREAGVPWEKLRKLKLREIEAIVRAPQYLYAAAMRGYFTPYEFELYNRLKELLQLTDYQVVQLFKRRGAK